MHKPLDSSESDDNVVMNAHIDYDGLRDKLHNTDELKYYNQIYQYKKELANRNVKFHISAKDLMDLHHDVSPIIHLNITRRASDSLLCNNPKKLVRSKTIDVSKPVGKIEPLKYQTIWLIKDYKIYYYHDTKKYNLFIIEKDVGKITCVGGDDHKIKTSKLLHQNYMIKTMNDVDIIYKTCDFTYPMYISCKYMTMSDFMNNLQTLLILND